MIKILNSKKKTINQQLIKFFMKGTTEKELMKKLLKE